MQKQKWEWKDGNVVRVEERQVQESMERPGIKIVSNFSDYYDYLSTESGIVYKREFTENTQRGSELKFLRSMGIKTIEIKQVNQFSYLDKELVVYTDPFKHKGHGKKRMTYAEAMSLGGNMVASRYIENNGVTIKFVQIGKRRFTLYLKRDDEDTSLGSGKILQVFESESCYNHFVRQPIFSIDYISDGVQMIATDFNSVQCLEDIGMNLYLSEEEVVREIADALIVYGKARV